MAQVKLSNKILLEYMQRIKQSFKESENIELTPLNIDYDNEENLMKQLDSLGDMMNLRGAIKTKYFEKLKENLEYTEQGIKSKQEKIKKFESLHEQRISKLNLNELNAKKDIETKISNINSFIKQAEDLTMETKLFYDDRKNEYVQEFNQQIEVFKSKQTKNTGNIGKLQEGLIARNKQIDDIRNSLAKAKADEITDINKQIALESSKIESIKKYSQDKKLNKYESKKRDKSILESENKIKELQNRSQQIESDYNSSENDLQKQRKEVNVRIQQKISELNLNNDTINSQIEQMTGQYQEIYASLDETSKINLGELKSNKSPVFDQYNELIKQAELEYENMKAIASQREKLIDENEKLAFEIDNLEVYKISLEVPEDAKKTAKGNIKLSGLSGDKLESAKQYNDMNAEIESKKAQMKINDEQLALDEQKKIDLENKKRQIDLLKSDKEYYSKILGSKSFAESEILKHEKKIYDIESEYSAKRDKIRKSDSTAIEKAQQEAIIMKEAQAVVSSQIGRLTGEVKTLPEVFQESVHKFSNTMIKLRFLFRGLQDVRNYFSGFQEIEDSAYALGIVGNLGVNQIKEYRKELLLAAQYVSFSAKEVANAQEQVIKTGGTLEDAKNIVKATSLLAQSAFEDLGSATDVNKMAA